MMAAAIVVGLGALVAVLVQNDRVPTTTTVSSTTTTNNSPTTATSATTTSTTTAEQRLAEVEVILQDLWFGWFDAIYRKDADALWEVVATTPTHDAGMAAMSGLEFISEPSQSGVQIEIHELLLDRRDCLVAHHRAFAGFIGDQTETVSVLWADDRYGWRFATSWVSPDDLWLQDCDNMTRESTP